MKYINIYFKSNNDFIGSDAELITSSFNVIPSTFGIGRNNSFKTIVFYHHWRHVTGLTDLCRYIDGRHLASGTVG